uniref:Thyroglobulin type-1 domain-containing protein n=1 Tax=Anabas testudineus TaxID=64144 RepID=A0A7N6AYD2_ANATE
MSHTCDSALPLNSTLQTGRCEYVRQNCSNSSIIGAFCPKCDSSGNYLPQQCSGSTGYCWCVDVNSGKMISNTTTPPGTPLDCGE